MLSGLLFEKKGKADAKEEKNKKDKKKEHRKEQKKKKKKAEKEKKTKKAESSASSAEESEKSEKRNQAPPDRKVASQQGQADDSVLAKAEVDFFSSLGAEQKKEGRLKPDPEKTKVSEMEYNPFLRGEKSSLPAPESVSSIPKDLCVGDGGSSWRRRMQRRAKEAPESQDGTVEQPTSAIDRAMARDEKQQNQIASSTRSNSSGGPSGGGWRAAKRGAVSKRSPSRQHSRKCSRSRSRSKSKKRSRSRQRYRSRSKSRKRSRSRQRYCSRSVSRSNSHDDAEARKEQVARAVLERVKSTEAGEEDDAEEVIRRLQSKYSGGGQSTSSNAQTAVAADVDEDIDANKLGAMAMEAMLSGDMARYEELNKRLEKKQASMATAGGGNNAFTLPAAGTSLPDNVKVLEEVDGAGRSKKLLESVESVGVHTKGRNKRGNANAVPGGKDKKGSQGYYENDEVSLDELVRRERIAGVQDYDGNFEKYILKKGGKFKMLDEDEDEAYALGWYEGGDKKNEMGSKKHDDRKMRQEKNDKNRVQMNLERCSFCMESKKFSRREAMISVSPHAYICADAFNRCVFPGQILIVPQEHASATTDLDELVWADMRNYMKCLVQFYDAEEPPRSVIFAETAVHRVSRDKALLGAGPHTCIVAYPIELSLLEQSKTFWRKALDEAESEFETTHKKVIAFDSKGGVRRAVPKGFPYVSADFGLGGGFAHVVDNVADFPRDFAQHTIAGMCEMTILDRAYSCKEEYSNVCRNLKQRFNEGFHWTKALKNYSR
eukprot:TRINITY_DN29437_c0_g1_i1.p1 TRINITY_DN29437_c0_g1~~TRINITY_DN29437_c0_g1_i1.p1  ORF type:complete len:786 (-),score=161.66 TRINITY_DN29437_c0_g1_i1:10-2328(-)